VKTWITFNEAWTFLYLGSGNGKAPSIPEYNDLSTWPFIGGHNVLLAHAEVVALYRSTFADTQGGTIGMTNNMDWREPLTTAPEDIGASQRAAIMWLGWYVTHGCLHLKIMTIFSVVLILFVFQLHVRLLYNLPLLNFKFLNEAPSTHLADYCKSIHV